MNGSERTRGERQERAWRRSGYEGGFVYVLEAPPLTAIKVGYTTTPVATRIAGLQTGCPYPLQARCVIPAPRKLETWLHHYMRPIRTCGEWFDGSAVKDHLKRLDALAENMRADHNGGPVPPDFEQYVRWIHRSIRKPPGKHQPVTVRHVDPTTLRRAA